MPADQNTANFFRFIYIILFIFSGFLVLTSIDPAMFEFTKVFEILNYLTLIVQAGVAAMGEIAKTITIAILSLKSRIPLIGDPNFGGINIGDINQMLTGIFSEQNGFFPHSTIPADADIIADFSIFIGATTILVLLPIAFFSGIGFLREGDTKLAIYSFLGFQLILIVAIFTQNIRISTQIDTSNLLSMILSPIFTLGFLLYLLLEVAFQTSYTLNIIEPMTEREKRIQGHLKRIRAFVPPTDEGKPTTDQNIQSVQSKKFGLLAASYLREMVERKVFRREETAQDPKSMMRLQSYLTNLNLSDPETDAKLAAKTAQPDISSLIRHFVPEMLFRIVAVVLLSYFIMAPDEILKIFMGSSFPALVDSLELSQPEFQTIAILNVALMMILLGALLKYIYSGKTKDALVRVVQQIDTLVDFDRTSPQSTGPAEAAEDDTESEEAEEIEVEEDPE